MLHWCLRVLTGAALLLSIAGIGGAEPASAPLFSDAEWAASAPRGGAPSADLGAGALASVAFALIGVAGLAVLLGWLARRAGLNRVLPRRGRHLEVVDTLPIGVKRSLLLVRVGDQVVLVGQAEQGMQHLGTFAAAGVLPPPAAEPEAPASVPAPPGAFAQLLGRMQGRRP